MLFHDRSGTLYHFPTHLAALRKASTANGYSDCLLIDLDLDTYARLLALPFVLFCSFGNSADSEFSFLASSRLPHDEGFFSGLQLLR